MTETIKLIDSSFQSFNPAKYQLSIQIFRDSIAVCLNEVGTSSPVALWNQKGDLEHFTTVDSFKAFLVDCPFSLFEPYRSTLVSFGFPYVTYVPSSLFDAQNVAFGVQLNCGELKEMDYAYDSLPALGLELSYAVPSNLFQMLKGLFPSANFRSHNTVLLSAVNRDFKPMDPEQIFVHIMNDTLELLAFNKGSFVLGNIFSIKTPEDLLYYLLASCEQLGFSPETCKVILLGEIKLGSEFHHLIFSYFQKIQFGVSQSKLKTPMLLNDVPKHQFYTLFHQYLCE